MPDQKSNQYIHDFTILLVEDDLINQQITKKILEKLGYNVILATNGMQAVTLYQNNSLIDLIMMDIQLPVADGIEATRMIREIEGGTGGTYKIPIVAVTGKATKLECIEAGCNEYLSKPIKIADLRKIFNTYLKKKN
ncbi:MAG: response regulator [bacterium]